MENSQTPKNEKKMLEEELKRNEKIQAILYEHHKEKKENGDLVKN